MQLHICHFILTMQENKCSQAGAGLPDSVFTHSFLQHFFFLHILAICSFLSGLFLLLQAFHQLQNLISQMVFLIQSWELSQSVCSFPSFHWVEFNVIDTLTHRFSSWLFASVGVCYDICSLGVTDTQQGGKAMFDLLLKCVLFLSPVSLQNGCFVNAKWRLILTENREL